MNESGFLSRFVALGSIPGKHKPQDSKQVYIQAIEIETLQKMDWKELVEQHQSMDQKDFTSSPYDSLGLDKALIEQLIDPAITDSAILSGLLDQLLNSCY